MSFTLDKLERFLNDQRGDGQSPSRYLVAFSGGVDSAVLLHSLAKIAGNVPVVAVHVDHCLHPDSRNWALHCEAFATSRQLEYIGHRADVRDEGAGIEAAARATRYTYFESLLQSGDWLLSAHHQDDQAETLLLNLLRGSGALGLAGIAVKRPCGRGWLVRPLLDVARADIEQFAEQESLDWIDDPSNRDTRFDRNFLRNDVLPLMRSRWPALSGRLHRSAELSSEACNLLNDLAALDLAKAGRAERLQVAALRSLSPARLRNLLRYALRSLNLPAPPATRLEQIANQLLHAREDAQPLVAWPGAEVRRYRDHVFLLLEATPCATLEATLAPGGSVDLGPGLGRLRLERDGDKGIDAAVAEAGLTVCFRAGGERIRTDAKARTHRLKTLLQETAIVPWMRSRIPLLRSGGSLVAVADLWTEAKFSADDGYVVHWDERPPLN